MPKKKDKPQVINNIQELNLEIDYDKLAEAIVKAKKKEALQQSNMKHRGTILGLFNILVYTTPIVLILKALVGLWSNCFQAAYPEIIANIIMCTVLTVSGIFISFLLGSAMKETLCDTEEQIVSHFNTNISVAALIVALIALFKGVG